MPESPSRKKFGPRPSRRIFSTDRGESFSIWASSTEVKNTGNSRLSVPAPLPCPSADAKNPSKLRIAAAIIGVRPTSMEFIMAASTARDKALKDFIEAQASFLIAYKALETTLTHHGARDKTAEHLLHHADGYGVDHTMAVLAKSPDMFEMRGPLSTTALSSVSKDLEAAYEASHRLDLALAAREEIAQKADPSHQKAVNILGREYTIDPASDTLIDRVSGRSSKASLTYVTGDDGGKPRDKERNR